MGELQPVGGESGGAGGVQLTNGDTVLIDEKAGKLKSVKAPSPRGEKGKGE